MKRYRRTRRFQRRGVQHVGDLLAILVEEIDQNDSTPQPASASVPGIPVTGATSAAAPGGIGQSTFSFYETAGG